MNVSDMTVSDEDGYLSCSKTFNSNNKIVKERIWIAMKLTIQNRVAKVDVETNARSRPTQGVQDYTYDKWFAGVTLRIRRNHKKRLVV